MGRDRGGMVDLLRRARMGNRRVCVDRLRLSRRALALWLALYQLAVRGFGCVWLSQGYVLLLQGLVAEGSGTAPVSSLELRRPGRRRDSRMGLFESRTGRTVPQRQKSWIAESAPPGARAMEGQVGVGLHHGERLKPRESGADGATGDNWSCCRNPPHCR